MVAGAKVSPWMTLGFEGGTVQEFRMGLYLQKQGGHNVGYESGWTGRSEELEAHLQQLVTGGIRCGSSRVWL